MTDYPTRAEIDAARDTLVYLHSHVDKSTLLALIAREALWDAARILDALDDVPGLHYPTPAPAPEPEPEPYLTAASVLKRAHDQAEPDSIDESILWAAYRYVCDAPEWFREPRCWHGLTTALYNAYAAAADSGDTVAALTLQTAHALTVSKPHLFGGAA